MSDRLAGALSRLGGLSVKLGLAGRVMEGRQLGESRVSLHSEKCGREGNYDGYDLSCCGNTFHDQIYSRPHLVTFSEFRKGFRKYVWYYVLRL